MIIKDRPLGKLKKKKIYTYKSDIWSNIYADKF